jgi:peptidoglycan hydrolase-like protein with peptidoglycan-binding domain
MAEARVIDIASWQHPGGRPIDFEAVYAAGYRGVMIKATQDVNYANPFFAQDYEAAKAAGLMVGAYHFCVFAASTPDAQAAFFLANTQGIDLELGRAADCEEPYTLPAHELGDWVLRFLQLIDEPSDFASLYTNQDGLNNILGAPWTYRLWGALLDVALHTNLWMNQTGTIDVPGVEGLCDVDTLFNIRNVNPPDGGGGVPPQPPPPPPPPGPTSEVFPMMELSQGYVNEQVKVLQFVLNGRENAGLTIDGDFGPITKAAVESYQLSSGLVNDGVVGPLTWAKLLA